MEQPQTWFVGNHEICFEPPDVLTVKVRGWITAEDAPKWVDIMREVTATGLVHCVVKMEPMPGFPYPRLSTEARQYLARNSNSDWLKSMVFVGGGLLQRITAKGLTVALLVSGRRPFAVGFVDTPEEARTWLAKQRVAQDR